MLHSGKLTPGAEDLVLGCAAVAAAFPLCPMVFLSKLPISFSSVFCHQGLALPDWILLLHSSTKTFLPRLSLLR